eukprot:SAG31_NODE_4201_length_3479_cov_1.626331_2_plen_137_part_00
MPLEAALAIADDGCQELAEVLKDGNSAIKQLWLGQNVSRSDGLAGYCMSLATDRGNEDAPPRPITQGRNPARPDTAVFKSIGSHPPLFGRRAIKALGVTSVGGGKNGVTRARRAAATDNDVLQFALSKRKPMRSDE